MEAKEIKEADESEKMMEDELQEKAGGMEDEAERTEVEEDEIKNLVEQEPEKNEALVEAALFIAGRYVALHEIVSLTNINPITLREILENLEKKYGKSGAMIITSREDRYKMDVKPEFHHLINRLALGEHEFTRAEQETLAIIAYKQPINQSVVVKIRSNKAYDHIKSLIRAGLVRGKKKAHTLELTLDESFYDYFSLNEKRIKKK